MATTVSSVWAKPGAWALDSEEHEEELKQDLLIQSQKPKPEPPAAEFPSLAAAASAAKPKKKNKGQTLSLAEFSTYSSAPKPASTEPQRLTQDELLMLPTGPRERTAEELDRTRLGGGFRNYGGGLGDNRDRVRGERNNREGYNGNSNRERDMGPSRADEVDDWSKTKKFNSNSFGGSERGERRERVGFFNSSRADEVDNWAAGKSFGSAQMDPPPRRERRMGFDSYSNGSGAGPDSDNWLKKKEERVGVDSDTWGRRREENSNNGNGNGNNSSNGRPRLNLQPRTLPVANNNGSSNEGLKAKGGNPFGEARPREEVLAEKGKDWKEIDEKLDTVKIKEAEKSEGFGRRRGFGIGRSDSGGDRDVKTWRKPETNGAVSPSLCTKKTEDIAQGTEDTAPTEKVAEEN